MTDWWAVLGLLFSASWITCLFSGIGGCGGEAWGWDPVLRLAYVVEVLVTGAVLGVAGLLGKCCWVKAVRRERTPELLWDEWERRKSGGGKKKRS